MRSKSILGTLFVTSALGLSLAGCRLDDRRLAAADTAWPATLPAPDQGPIQDRYGPPPQRIPVGRLASYDDGFAWADRSYALDRAFYDTPPDYGFAYDNDEPWVWQTSDRWAMYGDPYADDAWRYYYYQPGAVRPYFIRDDRYGYGYDDVGRLVAVFDLLGRLLPQSDLYRYDDPASRYYQRAYLMRQASLQAQPIVVTREVWLHQAPIIQRTTNVWINAAQQQPDWVRYRERTGDRFVRAFDDERRRRAPSLTTAKAAPQPSLGRDQRRGVFGRPVSEPQAQITRTEPDRRGLFGRPAQADRSGERSAPKPDHRGLATAPQGGGPDLRQAQVRKDDAQRAVQQDRREAKARDDQRQEQELGRKQKEAQQQDQQRQAEHARQQQQDQQRKAEAQAQRQQPDQQRQAEAQAQKLHQDQQRQAEAQAQKQRQDEAQAQKQHQDQQRQAEAQARQQQQAQQRQAEEQARQQQKAQQQQAQQQAQAQQAAKQQAQQQQAQQQAQKQKGQKQEAQATNEVSQPQGKGAGKGHKG